MAPATVYRHFPGLDELLPLRERGFDSEEAVDALAAAIEAGLSAGRS